MKGLKGRSAPSVGMVTELPSNADGDAELLGRLPYHLVGWVGDGPADTRVRPDELLLD
jgi:hypothetical protein